MPNKDMAKTAKRMYFCSFKEQYTFKKNRYIYLPELSLPKLPENLNCEYHNR